MTVIDAHHHPDRLGHDLPKFLANMDRFGIDFSAIEGFD